MKYLLILSMVITTSTHAYEYTGKGLTANGSAEIELQEHMCLAFMTFLEARGDGHLSQMFHGMSTINRALNTKRWGLRVCDVLTEPSQYESIHHDQWEVVQAIKANQYHVLDRYIANTFKKRDDIEAWYRINDLTHSLITEPTLPEEWIATDHFYAPKSLQRRNLPVPTWVYEMDVLYIAGNTHFLKEP